MRLNVLADQVDREGRHLLVLVDLVVHLSFLSCGQGRGERCLDKLEVCPLRPVAQWLLQAPGRRLLPLDRLPPCEVCSAFGLSHTKSFSLGRPVSNPSAPPLAVAQPNTPPPHAGEHPQNLSCPNPPPPPALCPPTLLPLPPPNCIGRCNRRRTAVEAAPPRAPPTPAAPASRHPGRPTVRPTDPLAPAGRGGTRGRRAPTAGPLRPPTLRPRHGGPPPLPPRCHGGGPWGSLENTPLPSHGWPRNYGVVWRGGVRGVGGGGGGGLG